MTPEVLTIEEIERIRRKLEDAVYGPQDEADLDAICAAARRLISIEQEARNQALEEAARVADAEGSPERMLERFSDEFATGVIGASRSIAAAIRALIKPSDAK